MVKLSREMYPGTHIEYRWWAATFDAPWDALLDREEEITVNQAIALGFAVLAQRPLTEDNKTFLVALFYAINDDPA